MDAEGGADEGLREALLRVRNSVRGRDGGRPARDGGARAAGAAQLRLLSSGSGEASFFPCPSTISGFGASSVAERVHVIFLNEVQVLQKLNFVQFSFAFLPPVW